MGIDTLSSMIYSTAATASHSPAQPFFALEAPKLMEGPVGSTSLAIRLFLTNRNP